MSTMCTDPDDRAQHLMARAEELSDLMMQVEGELETAIYRAHQLGLPHAEIARRAQRDVSSVAEIVGRYDTYEMDDDELEVSWARRVGGAIFL